MCAGQIATVAPDILLLNDVSGPLAFDQFDAMGATAPFGASRVILVADHFAPAKDVITAEALRILRGFARTHGIAHVYDLGRGGIEHALRAELGLVGHGTIVFGADNMAGEATGEALVTQMRAADVGILQVQDDYGAASANAIEAVLGRANIKVVGRETYGARDNHFSAQLLSLKNKGAQALVAISYVRDGALVLTQRRTLGVTAPLIGNSSFVNPALLDLVTPADVDGIYSIMDAVIGDARSPASGAYAVKFLDRFKMRSDPFGSCYYDAAMILADGLRTVGTDKAKLRDYFAAVKGYDGVTRTYTTDGRNDMAHSVALASFAPGTKDLKLVTTYPAQPA